MALPLQTALAPPSCWMPQLSARSPPRPRRPPALLHDHLVLFTHRLQIFHIVDNSEGLSRFVNHVSEYRFFCASTTFSPGHLPSRASWPRSDRTDTSNFRSGIAAPVQALLRTRPVSRSATSWSLPQHQAIHRHGPPPRSPPRTRWLDNHVPFQFNRSAHPANPLVVDQWPVMPPSWNPLRSSSIRRWRL